MDGMKGFKSGCEEKTSGDIPQHGTTYVPFMAVCDLSRFISSIRFENRTQSARTSSTTSSTLMEEMTWHME
jgi:hypothetical protein